MYKKLIKEIKSKKYFKSDFELFKKLIKLFYKLVNHKKEKYNRVLPFGDYFVDRWEKAKFLGFGEGTSIYDNVIVLGSVSVGKNTWIGPNVVLDGSGNLTIGSNCSISAGVQIYTHDSIQWAISGGKEKYEYEETSIGDNCYIAPNVVISKGVTIGSGTIIGAGTLINKDIPKNSKAYGSPLIIKEL